MALPILVRQLVESKLTNYCDSRVPEEAKSEVQLKFKIRGNFVTLLETRPIWNNPSANWSELKIAQFRYDETKNEWDLYCCDRNEKWFPYLEVKSTQKLDDLLEVVSEDPTGIFWG